VLRHASKCRIAVTMRGETGSRQAASGRAGSAAEMGTGAGVPPEFRSKLADA